MIKPAVLNILNYAAVLALIIMAMMWGGEDAQWRVWVLGGESLILAPLIIWSTSVGYIKIGKRLRLADLIREHVRLYPTASDPEA